MHFGQKLTESTNKYNVAMDTWYYQVKQAKSKISSKLIGPEYFGVITQNSIIFLLVSIEAIINLLPHILFEFFKFKTSVNLIG